MPQLETRSLLLSPRYYLDELKEPASYVLKPVSANIEKYLNDSEEVYREGYRQWEKNMIHLHHVLLQRSPLEFQNNVCKSGKLPDPDRSRATWWA